MERTSFLYDGTPIAVTVSVGFAVAGPDSRADYPRMEHLASTTVHEAKVAGRDHTVVRSLEPELVVTG